MRNVPNHAIDDSEDPTGGSRLVVVSNRLPVRRVAGERGSSWRLSPGGLVSALQPILSRQGGTWIGWPGDSNAANDPPFQYEGMELCPVAVGEVELERYYDGFCNRTIWPLYHDAIRSPCYRRAWWDPFVRINRRFAEAVLDVARPGDLIWVQDYQLQLVPSFVRERAPDARIGFFLHTPFPPVDLLGQLPWRRTVLEGLLSADVLGFQTQRGAENFIKAARILTSARREGAATLSWGGRPIHVGAFPISIDAGRFEAIARRPEVKDRARRLRADLGYRKLVLGVDRLDYSKGIQQRFEAFESLLARDPRRAAELVMVQVAVPTRENVPDYVDLRRSIEQLAGRINGRFGEPGHVPVHFLCTNLPPEELVAYYLAADVMAVTPLRDGMNLVAKEFVATRLDDSGALILSEFAGAAQELRHAMLVNPHDHDALVETFERALHLSPVEAERRMHDLRQHVRTQDVYVWADRFLARLGPPAAIRPRSKALPLLPRPSLLETPPEKHALPAAGPDDATRGHGTHLARRRPP